MILLKISKCLSIIIEIPLEREAKSGNNLGLD